MIWLLVLGAWVAVGLLVVTALFRGHREASDLEGFPRSRSRGIHDDHIEPSGATEASNVQVTSSAELRRRAAARSNRSSGGGA